MLGAGSQKKCWLAARVWVRCAQRLFSWSCRGRARSSGKRPLAQRRFLVHKRAGQPRNHRLVCLRRWDGRSWQRDFNFKLERAEKGRLCFATKLPAVRQGLGRPKVGNEMKEPRGRRCRRVNGSAHRGAAWSWIVRGSWQVPLSQTSTSGLKRAVLFLESKTVYLGERQAQRV